MIIDFLYRSMEKMNSFLSDAADRELETRSKLEQFIASLVDRSAQAEAELQKMKHAYAAKVKELAGVTRVGYFFLKSQ